MVNICVERNICSLEGKLVHNVKRTIQGKVREFIQEGVVFKFHSKFENI